MQGQFCEKKKEKRTKKRPNNNQSSESYHKVFIPDI